MRPGLLLRHDCREPAEELSGSDLNNLVAALHFSLIGCYKVAPFDVITDDSYS